MTTLHITNAYHPASGGIRTFYQALLDASDRHLRRVVIVVPGPSDDVEFVGHFGRVYWVRAPRAPAFDRRYRLLLPHTYFPGLAGRLIEILRREQPDIVEICDKYSLPYLAAMLRKQWHPGLRRPALIGLSCERFDDNMAAYLSAGSTARAFTRWYIRHIYGPPFDVHVAVSEYAASELREALHDRAPGFIRVCPMGVDIERFGPEHADPAWRLDMLRRCGGSAESVLLLYAGRVSPEKNIGLLVKSLRALVNGGDADYRLVVAGDGPLVSWLRTQASGSLEGRITLLGNVDRHELPRYCASCDVFVHPNPREPFGICPLEAMASGVPVVLPASGGVLEYASDANAWLAAPNGDEYAAAVRKARIGDRRKTGAARATARRFRWSEVASRYFAVYDEIAPRFRLEAAS